MTGLYLCMHAQSCPTFCHPRHCSPTGSSVHGIFQARILEWVTIALSRGSSRPSMKVKVKVLVAQLCPIPCDPMDCSPTGSSVHGILQARILEWGAIPFSRESSQPRDQTRVSYTAGRFVTIWMTRVALRNSVFFIKLMITIVLKSLSFSYTCWAV